MSVVCAIKNERVRVVFDMDTLAVNNETIHGYPMERLIREHSTLLYIITIGSLVLYLKKIIKTTTKIQLEKEIS